MRISTPIPVLVILVAGCSRSAPAPARPTEAQLIAVSALDPLFGTRDTLAWLILAIPELRWADDQAARSRFLLHDLQQHAPDLGRVAEAFDGASRAELDEIVAFLHSDSGRRIGLACGLATAAYPNTNPDLPKHTLAAYSRPHEVGELAARRQAAMLIEEERALSISPSQQAIEVGAPIVRPDDARALQAFLDTPAGDRWRLARQRIWESHDWRSLSLKHAAIRSGAAEDMVFGEEQLEDLILPEAEFAVPDPADDAGK